MVLETTKATAEKPYPKISVLIPAYNASKTLANCLSALKQQSIPASEYEIIVINDGSEDDTAKIAQAAEVKLINLKHQGPAAARNRGAKEAVGELILFTDADCEPDPDWIKQMSLPFGDAEIVAVKGAYQTKQKNLISRFAQLEFEDRYKYLLKKPYIDFVDSYSAGYRRSVFLNIGGFDPHFPVANNEDVDLSYKLAAAYYKMVFNPKAVVYHKHPSCLWDYLDKKFLRAYWRAVVYRRFPNKMISDSYTPQILKLQIVLAYLPFLLLLLGFFVEHSLTFFFLGFIIFTISCLPFFVLSVKSDFPTALLSPLILYFRSIVFGLGAVAGSLSENRRNYLLPALLIFTDITVCTVSLFLTYWIRNVLLKDLLPSFDHPFFVYSFTWPFVVIAWLVTYAAFGLYRQRRISSRLRDFTSQTKAISLIALFFMSGAFLYKFDLSRPVIIMFWFCSLIISVLARSAVRHLQEQMQRKGYNLLRAVILGTGETARLLVKKMQDNPALGYKIIGFVEENSEPSLKKIGSLAVLGGLEELVQIIDQERIDEVFIAKLTISHELLLKIFLMCEEANVSFRIISDLFEMVTSKVDLDDVADIPIVEFSNPSGRWLSALLKTGFDYFAATITFLITSPLWLLVALVIKLNVPQANILSRQTILGSDQKPFYLLKFNLRLISRITNKKDSLNLFNKLFSFLIDNKHLETLPSLLNVLKGQISLVGPKPLTPQEFQSKNYSPEWLKVRFHLKPGLTGFWRIFTQKRIPLTQEIEHDFYYYRNYSLLLDLSILLRSIL